MFRGSHAVATSTFLASALVAAALAAPLVAQQQGEAGTVSFFAADQVTRGNTVFQNRCAGCHNTDLTGEKRGSARGGPALTGPQFMANWEGESLDGLLTRMKTLMPRDDPGGLADDVYLDLLALIAKVNGLPGGTARLTAEAVPELQFPQKPGAAKTIRNFKLVQVVGCVAQTDRVWSLTNTSEPAVTKDQPATSAELQAAGVQPLGAETFRLVSVKAFAPEAALGRKVLAKGLLYRAAPGGNRLNVTSIQPLGQSCAH